jgi:hypothetical protein
MEDQKRTMMDEESRESGTASGKKYLGRRRWLGKAEANKRQERRKAD